VQDASTRGPIRVLVCDDSVVAREMLVQILDSDPEIQVVGQCVDGAEAVRRVAELQPDLVTMDIHMPVMDGLTATEQIMAFTPTPILVVSSSVHGEGVGRAFDAMTAGALEVMKKPEPIDWADLGRIGRQIIRTVKILARVPVITHVRGKGTAKAAAALEAEKRRTLAPRSPGGVSLVAIGSSTGGPSALAAVLGALPASLPVPVVVAQHIAEGFVPGLVNWLATTCDIGVAEAHDGTELAAGTAYFAPTDSNLIVEGVTAHTVPTGDRLYVPSADVLFSSVATEHRNHGLGVLLTGMGADGADGLRLMREQGAATIAQDEDTSVVWGMPGAAVQCDAAAEVLPLTAIGPRIARLVAGRG
jgi:two-component system, chemotaxis family, protein-glutamate methylesterase/glutaminase